MRFPEDFSPVDGVWRARQASGTLDYTDGAAAERYLFEVLTAAEDLGSGSEQLRDRIVDWPSRYHLSPERGNLVRCLRLSPEADVLEIGAGCGGITRALGERCARVVALEGSPSRARLCHLRCRDLPSVQVVAGDAFQLEMVEQFDVVTLIGVLEYAGVYCRQAADPWQKLLEVAADRLRPGGQLIVAIENQFGIKYFAGCSEDHGEPRFAGIEGYPDEGGVRTFGRQALARRLELAGLSVSHLLLPFPDYKVPNTIVNAEHADAASARRFGLSDWCRRPYSDYSRPRDYLLDDHLAISELADNGLLADLSNSFLFVASKPEGASPPVPPADWVARRYNSLRHRAYATCTTLRATKEGPVVEKQRLFGSGPSVAVGSSVEHRLDVQEPYVEHGHSMAMAMVRALRRQRGAEPAFTELLGQWLGFFRPEHAEGGSLNLLQGQFVDCVPDNLFRSGTGPWQYIDREWSMREPVLLDWVFYRGLIALWEHHSLAIAGAQSRKPGTRARFVARAFELLGSPLAVDEWRELEAREAHFQSVVRFGESAARSLRAAPTTPPEVGGWAIPGRSAVVLGSGLQLP